MVADLQETLIPCSYIREILLARIRNPIDVICHVVFLQACLKEKVPGNIKIL